MGRNLQLLSVETKKRLPVTDFTCLRVISIAWNKQIPEGIMAGMVSLFLNYIMKH